MKIKFNNDYMEGAHPSIIQRLSEINLEKNVGYGEDQYCKDASTKILQACGVEDGEVIFLVGGTQTNAFVIDAILDRCEGVLSAETGHIACHEAGAVEAWGHKILTLPEKEGKITAKLIKDYCDKFYKDPSYTHMVAPGMVYISLPTELGTLYSYEELSEMYETCKSYGLTLFVDGARLGYGLAASGSNLNFSRLAMCCDVFYIGGTKMGALFGEAVVITNRAKMTKKIPLIKNHGALLAKGWLLGVQFDTLFTDNRYIKIAENAIHQAMLMKDVFLKHGYALAFDSPTNQQFIIVPKSKLEELSKHVDFTFWEEVDAENVILRFVTSWATTEEQINQLDEVLNIVDNILPKELKAAKVNILI